MRALLLAVALLALPARSALALPAVNDAIVGQGFTNFDESDESRAYGRLIQGPQGALPRVELIYDMDNGSMRGVEEFNCARQQRRLLWAIQYRQSGLRDEMGRVGEQNDWVTVDAHSLDGGAFLIACSGLPATQSGGK